ncbi:MAG: peptide deformylase [Bacteroidetes bacterium]|nr:peptide deformylase [Bacteroidota bacterium]MDA1333640.1 peptide deformylase [Bacteroidota bacterium]
MILPIHLLGTDVLREPTEHIDADSPELQSLIDDMIETMHGASGIGLAAPQIGRKERLFVVDVSPMERDFEEAGLEMPEQPMIFLNAEIVAESEDDSDFEEGCLSIPDIHEVVIRPDAIRLRYQDRNLKEMEEEFDGILSRVIQHEYDHVDGVLFIDHLSAFKRRLLRRRLEDIRQGLTEAEYPVYADGKGVIEPKEIDERSGEDI